MKLETLRTDISVALHTLRRPLGNKLVGRGVSRKRDPFASVMVAEHMIRMIARNHRFRKEDELASTKVLESYLTGILQQLPDALVYQFASKSQMQSLAAAEEIVERLLEAMEVGWNVTHEEPVIVAHSAKF